MSDQWMYRVVGAEFGPVPQDELLQMLQEGLVSEDDEVRPVDQSAWRPANTYAELGFAVESRTTTTATVERGADEWYCKVFGTELGPLAFDELLRMAENSEISADDEVRLGASGKWRRVGSIGRLMSVLPFQEVKKEVVRKPKPRREPVNLDRDTSAGQTAATSADMPTAEGQVSSQHFTPSTTPATTEKQWYAWIKGSEYGPVPLSQLAAWMKTGQLGLSDHVREGTDGEYQSARDVPGLGLPPGAQPRRSTPTPAPARPAPAPEPEPVRAAVPEFAPAPSSPAPSSSFSSPSSSSGSSSFSAPAAPAWGGASSGFGSPAPAVNRPAPAPVKKPRSSGGGGGMSVSMPSVDLTVLKDPKLLGGAAVALLVVLWFFMPASQRADIEIYNKQKAWLTELQSAVASKQLSSAAAKYTAEADAMTKDLKSRLDSSAPHRKFLMWNAQYRLKDIGDANPKKAEQAVKDFEANLKQVAQYLKL